MALIVAYKNRGLTKNLTILDAAGESVTPGNNDKVRAVIAREGHRGTSDATAELSVTSGTPTDNGSAFNKNSPSTGVNQLRLDASDLAFSPGVYTLFVEYFDNADAQEWKTVDRQVFVLRN